jgi:Flp pilus assembly protein TadB
MLAEIGLILIAFGWLIQVYFSWKNDKEIKSLFLVFYIAGVILLVVNGAILSGLTLGVILEFLTLLLAGIVLFKVSKKEKKAITKKKK